MGIELDSRPIFHLMHYLHVLQLAFSSNSAYCLTEHQLRVRNYLNLVRIQLNPQNLSLKNTSENIFYSFFKFLLLNMPV
jgi:hypothetical protein